MSSDSLFRVCAYDATGRWQPGVAGVPAVLRTPGGWLRGGDAAALAAFSAAAAGSTRVVVVDRDDASVMELDGRRIVYPPEWVDASRNFDGVEVLRDIVQKRVLVDLGRDAFLRSGVSREAVEFFSDEWLGAVAVDLTHAQLEPAALSRLVPHDGLLACGDDTAPDVIVVPRPADGVAFHALRAPASAAYLTPRAAPPDLGATRAALRQRLREMGQRGAQRALVAVGKGPEARAFVDLVREACAGRLPIEPVVAQERAGWFDDLGGRERRHAIGR